MRNSGSFWIPLCLPGFNLMTARGYTAVTFTSSPLPIDLFLQVVLSSTQCLFCSSVEWPFHNFLLNYSLIESYLPSLYLLICYAKLPHHLWFFYTMSIIIALDILISPVGNSMGLPVGFESLFKFTFYKLNLHVFTKVYKEKMVITCWISWLPSVSYTWWVWRVIFYIYWTGTNGHKPVGTVYVKTSE